LLAIPLTVNTELEHGKVGRQFRNGDVTRLIEPNSILIGPGGKPLVVFGRLERDYSQIKAYLPHFKYHYEKRLGRTNRAHESMKHGEIGFGFFPKKPMFNLAAAANKFNYEEPGCYRLFCELAQDLMGYIEKYNPERYLEQLNQSYQIHERWKLPNTFFTGGNINDTANLDYHYDKGNFKDCWSAMAVFRRDTVGGNLAIPALNCELQIEDETFVLFDGQSMLHAVTPITKTKLKGRRFSVVFYGLQQLKNAGTYDEELQFMRDSDMRKQTRNAQSGAPIIKRKRKYPAITQ